MKVIITGANGFVGAAFCRYFHHAGYQVIAIGRQANPSPNLLAFATYIKADITHPLDVFDADICIHAAALASDMASYDELFLNNVTGTENVLRAAVNCAYFVFISSSSVYNFDGKILKESDATLDAELSLYGRTKLMAEQLVAQNIMNQKRLVLRPRAIYGIGDRLLLPRLLKLVKGNTIFCPVDISVTTSMVNVKNLAYAIGLFLKQENCPDLQIFNVADDKVYCLQDTILKILKAVEGKALKLVIINPWLLRKLFFINSKIPFTNQLSYMAFKTITQSSVLDLAEIREKLKYDPAYTLDNSCDEVVEWLNNMGGKSFYLKNISDVSWL